MIRKLLASSALFLAALCLHAGTATITVAPATFTNLLAYTANLGGTTLKQITIAATTANSNTTVIFVDTASNYTYVTPAYTNTIRYATNQTYFWTNFYGVVQTNVPAGSNLVLLTFTNNLVPSTTNLYPQRFAASASAGNTTVIQAAVGTSEGVYFDNGIWVTNASSGNALITIVY
jgi:hypothetical protein